MRVLSNGQDRFDASYGIGNSYIHGSNSEIGYEYGYINKDIGDITLNYNNQDLYNSIISIEKKIDVPNITKWSYLTANTTSQDSFDVNILNNGLERYSTLCAMPGIAQIGELYYLAFMTYGSYLYITYLKTGFVKCIYLGSGVEDKTKSFNITKNHYPIGIYSNTMHFMPSNSSDGTNVIKVDLGTLGITFLGPSMPSSTSMYLNNGFIGNNCYYNEYSYVHCNNKLLKYNMATGLITSIVDGDPLLGGALISDIANISVKSGYLLINHKYTSNDMLRLINLSTNSLYKKLSRVDDKCPNKIPLQDNIYSIHEITATYVVLRSDFGFYKWSFTKQNLFFILGLKSAQVNKLQTPDIMFVSGIYYTDYIICAECIFKENIKLAFYRAPKILKELGTLSSTSIGQPKTTKSITTTFSISMKTNVSSMSLTGIAATYFSTNFDLSVLKKGDMIYADADGAIQTLKPGPTQSELRIVSGVPTWQKKKPTFDDNDPLNSYTIGFKYDSDSLGYSVDPDNSGYGIIYKPLDPETTTLLDVTVKNSNQYSDYMVNLSSGVIGVIPSSDFVLDDVCYPIAIDSNQTDGFYYKRKSGGLYYFSKSSPANYLYNASVTSTWEHFIHDKTNRKLYAVDGGNKLVSYDLVNNLVKTDYPLPGFEFYPMYIESGVLYACTKSAPHGVYTFTLANNTWKNLNHNLIGINTLRVIADNMIFHRLNNKVYFMDAFSVHTMEVTSTGIPLNKYNGMGCYDNVMATTICSDKFVWLYSTGKVGYLSSSYEIENIVILNLFKTIKTARSIANMNNQTALIIYSDKSTQLIEMDYDLIHDMINKNYDYPGLNIKNLKNPHIKVLLKDISYNPDTIINELKTTYFK